MLKNYATTLWSVDHILQIIAVVAFKLVLNRKENIIWKTFHYYTLINFLQRNRTTWRNICVAAQVIHLFSP